MERREGFEPPYRWVAAIRVMPLRHRRFGYDFEMMDFFFGFAIALLRSSSLMQYA